MGGLDRWVAVEALETVYTDSRKRFGRDIWVSYQPCYLPWSHRCPTNVVLRTRLNWPVLLCGGSCGTHVIVACKRKLLWRFGSTPGKYDSQRFRAWHETYSESQTISGYYPPQSSTRATPRVRVCVQARNFREQTMSHRPMGKGGIWSCASFQRVWLRFCTRHK